MRSLLPVSLAFLSANTVAEAPNTVYITDFGQTRAGRMSAASLHEERDRADKYALASKLAALGDGNPDEVRFWLTWATFDPSTNGIATVGYVVTDRNSRMCRIGYSAKSTMPENARCRRYTPHRGRGRTMADLVRLSAFADFSVDCNIEDGAWVLIDAVSNGKRFVLSASNPEFCDGDVAKLVSESLDEVTKAAPLP